MSPVHLRNLGIPRNLTQDRDGLSGTRIYGGGHLGHSGGWQDTWGNHTSSSIHLSIQHKPHTIGLLQGLFEVKRAWNLVNWDSVMEGSKIWKMGYT
ncbi:hypothetical protein O181_021400 [Austropuccinia psidii MF-1]|uniref:Uncharacterized protein n=1 Tax=Austropuccinia psidii MF-1 TaxID=1389203 RepID=A0A9Q3CEK8_9BASI|nr:hypothetical protein [Austropuccinia psidii MF-1]